MGECARAILEPNRYGYGTNYETSGVRQPGRQAGLANGEASPAFRLGSAALLQGKEGRSLHVAPDAQS